MKKLLYVVTVSQSLNLLKGQLEYMIDKGYEVFLITSAGKEIENLNENINLYIVEMERDISIFTDLKALFKMINIIRKINPDIINYGTPKASLLSSFCAWLLRIPCRIYTVRGLRYETLNGIKKVILINLEKVTMKLSTNIISISPSLKDKMQNERLTNKKITVLGSGSSNGINIQEFLKAKYFRENMRKKYGFTESTIILGNIGRLSNDKGVTLLVDTFLKLTGKTDLKLLLVGNHDDADPLSKSVKNKILNSKNIIHIPHQIDTIPFYSMIDIFVFPTFREGFGNVSIEAATVGIPVIASNVTGAKDTIIDNETGLLFEVNNNLDLADKIMTLIKNSKKRIEFGIAGQKRAIREFDNKKVWMKLHEYYESVLN